ncbi:MAG: hypothetical protein GVY16_02450 [Planctomycetes bacterium]|jgi:hypothetical protein|nr:hypothetical protein [Planctomycetota bacterium]
MRYFSILTMLLTALALAAGGCGRRTPEADAGDVPVIQASHSEAPAPRAPDAPEPVRLELPAESGADSFAAAEPAGVDTLSDAAPQSDALRRATRDQQLVDLASLRPVGSAREVPDVPEPPSLADHLADKPDGDFECPKLAPLPEPDVEPISGTATTVEVAQPAYEAPREPKHRTAEPLREPRTTQRANDKRSTSEPTRPASPEPRRRLRWEPRPNPLAGAFDEPTDATDKTILSDPSLDDESAPTPLTAMADDQAMAASVGEPPEPEDTGPAAEEAIHMEPVARPPAPREEMFTEKVVAGMTLQVNQRHVTVDEILAALHGELISIPDNLSRQAFRREAERIISRQLMGLIQQILVYEEAKDLLEEQAKMQIEAEMEETQRDLLASAGGSIERLKAQIRQEGSTLDALLQAHRRQLTVRSYMQYKFVPAIVVTRRMLWDYYRRHEDDYRTETKVQMQIIAAPFDDFLPEGTTDPTQIERQAAREAARRVIERALKRLAEGADFAEVARQYSEGIKADAGGVWPLMGKGNFAEAKVEQAAFELEEGEASGIVETDRGYYIVRAREVQPGNVVSFEEAQGDIRRGFQDEQLSKLRGEYMQKLYKNATISPPEDFVRLAVDRAVDRYWR